MMRRNDGLKILAVLLLCQISPSVSADSMATAMMAYENGYFDVAHKIFLTHAKGNNPAAQFYLGEIYDGGMGVPLNYNAAFKWYLKSADQDFSKARTRLGYLYSKGLGTRKDQSRALKWFLLAAEDGEVEAQFLIAFMYSNGHGTPMDLVQAYKWWLIAAAYGEPDALEEARRIEAHMTPRQLKQAASLASDWETKR